MCHPFVKWVGGKGQLLKEINRRLPEKITRYAEPFVGGGALLFDLLSRHDLSAAFISDVNKELITTYSIIKYSVNDLIEQLQQLQSSYMMLGPEERESYYYYQRDEYNKIKKSAPEDCVLCASLFIFLNKTCFNGLHRVNKSGLFNAAHGRYQKPAICDENNLRSISAKMRNVQIVYGPYTRSKEFITPDTFVYMDPPYKPVNDSGFTSYTEYTFGDDEQRYLAEYIKELDSIGAKILLSNSDPKSVNDEDTFFDDLYKGFTIERVSATRVINCDSKGRGKVNELLIRNY